MENHFAKKMHTSKHLKGRLRPFVVDVTVGFSWFQAGFHGFSYFLVDFSWFQVGFHGSRLVFHSSRWVFMVFYGSRLVFHGSRLVFHGSGLVFHGSRWVLMVLNCILARRSSLGLGLG